MSPYLATVGIGMVAPLSIVMILYGRYLKSLSEKTQNALAASTEVTKNKHESTTAYVLIYYFKLCKIFFCSRVVFMRSGPHNPEPLLAEEAGLALGGQPLDDTEKTNEF